MYLPLWKTVGIASYMKCNNFLQLHRVEKIRGPSFTKKFCFLTRRYKLSQAELNSTSWFYLQICTKAFFFFSLNF